MKALRFIGFTLLVMALAGCPTPIDDQDDDDTLTIDVVDVSLSVSGIRSLELGETLQLTATVDPANANSGLTWSSSNTAAATVSQSGLVTPAAEGTTVITVASTKDPNNINDSCTIVVIAAGTAADMSGWKLYNQLAAPVEGTTTELPEFINGEMIVTNKSQGGFASAGVTNTTFVYYDTPFSGEFSIRARVKSYEAVATGTGLGVTVGAYAQTAPGEFGEAVKMVTMQVRNANGGDKNAYWSKTGDNGNGNPKESGIDVPKEVERIYQVSRSADGFTLGIYDSTTGALVEGMEASLPYASINAAITADSPMYLGFTVTGVTAEISNVVITSGGVEQYATVSIPAEPVTVSKVTVTGPELNPDVVDGTYVYHYQNSLEDAQADTITLTAAVTPAFADDPTVSWISSNEAVATVADGVVTVEGAGAVTITARANDGTGFEGTYKMKITDGDVLVSSIEISGSTTVLAGTTAALTASVSPRDATNQVLAWSSSDTDVATVNENGVVTGWNVRAGEEDTGSIVTITATATDGSGVSATFDMTVIEIAGQRSWNFQILPSGWTENQNYSGPNVEYGQDLTLLTSTRTMKINTAQSVPSTGGETFSDGCLQPGGSGNFATVTVQGPFTIMMNYAAAGTTAGGRWPVVLINDVAVTDQPAEPSSGTSDGHSYTCNYDGTDLVTVTLASDPNAIRLFDLTIVESGSGE